MTGGSVDIQSNGQIDFEQGSASQGAAFNVESNGQLEFLGPFTFDTTTTITGSGALVLSRIDGVTGELRFHGFH